MKTRRGFLGLCGSFLLAPLAFLGGKRPKGLLKRRIVFARMVERRIPAAHWEGTIIQTMVEFPDGDQFVYGSKVGYKDGVFTLTPVDKPDAVKRL